MKVHWRRNHTGSPERNHEGENTPKKCEEGEEPCG